jgi:hypothetical protein
MSLSLEFISTTIYEAVHQQQQQQRHALSSQGLVFPSFSWLIYISSANQNTTPVVIV